MYVLPGFVDMHVANGGIAGQGASMPDYGSDKLWLAHGVTTVRGVSLYWGTPTPVTGRRKKARAA